MTSRLSSFMKCIIPSRAASSNDNIGAIYHLSPINHDNEYFCPRVPKSHSDSEDNLTKRVCFAKTISGAWRGHILGGAGDHAGETRYREIYVHVPANNIKRKYIKIPDKYEVYDAEITDEVWVLKPVKMKCIGLIQIGADEWQTLKRYKVHFKWLRKFND